MTHQVAIVGAGPGGLIAYTALRYRGLPDEDVVMVDTHPIPLDVWGRSTSAIAQRTLRSESEGHFFATDFPGFALLEALHRGSPAPLLRSVVNRYNPSLVDVLKHARALSRHFDLDSRVQQGRVARIRREVEPDPHFALHDANDEVLCRARHVLLALGHGDLRWPEACADPEVRARLGSRLYHAYQGKPYKENSVLVIGSGMAAVTEWVNVLRAGGTVIALRRAPQLREQPLSAPRCSFAGPWLDRFHRLDAEARSATLKDLARGSFPRPSIWKRLLQEATADGRLRMRVGELESIGAATDGGASVLIREPEGVEAEPVTVDTVIAATGFTPGWAGHDVIRSLVADYGIETYGQHLVLADDCTVPGISRPDSVLALSGPLAAWSYPAADSFAGMKYSARRFSEYAVGGRRVFRPRSWWDMVRGGWPYRREVTSLRGDSEQCASP